MIFPSNAARRAVTALASLAAALLVVPGCTASTGDATNSSSSSSSAGIRIKGNTFVDDAGKRVLLTGVTDYLLPFYKQGTQPDVDLERTTDVDYARRDADFKTMRAAKYNTVRVPLNADVFYHDVYGNGGSSGYLERMRKIVASARKAGIYIVFAWWGQFEGMTDAGAGIQPALNMMRTVAKTFGDDDHVLFEPINEPHDLSWPQWLDRMSSMLQWWRKTIGYKSALILDTINYSWDFNPSAATTLQRMDASLLGGKSQIAFANHRYANQSTCFCGQEQTSWQQTVGKYVGDYPIVGTEYGWYNNMGPPRPTWNDQLLTYLSRTSVPAGLNGALAFVWHWVDDNSMTGTNSTPNAFADSYDARFVGPAVSHVDEHR